MRLSYDFCEKGPWGLEPSPDTGTALLTQMCWRSLLFTGYKTQLVPTSFTAHDMSMLVTTPDWLSWEKKTSHHLFHNDME